MLILEAASIQPIELVLGFLHRAFEHHFAILGLIVVGLDSPRDVPPQILELPLQFRDIGGNLLVFRMVDAIGRLDHRQLLARLIHPLIQLDQSLALARNLSRFETPALHRVEL